VFGKSSPNDAVSEDRIVPQSDALEKPKCEAIEAIGSRMPLAIGVTGSDTAVDSVGVEGQPTFKIRGDCTKFRVSEG
jgi:hypothetical protein